jgi:ribosomal protein L37AE/L43A
MLNLRCPRCESHKITRMELSQVVYDRCNECNNTFNRVIGRRYVVKRTNSNAINAYLKKIAGDKLINKIIRGEP